MARYVQLTYKIWVADGDDDDCIGEAEDALQTAFDATGYGDDLARFEIERAVTISGSGSQGPTPPENPHG